MDPQALLLAATGQAAAAALASSLPNLNSSKGFKHLLDTQSLVDCTLACNGGKISAHKIVLSACSQYLARILMEHPTEHPIIILPELSIDDVKTLVHYMYTGELLKSANKINSTSLLRTAAILSINSLNDVFTTAAAMQQHQLFASSGFNLSNSNISSANSNSNNDSQFIDLEALTNTLQQRHLEQQQELQRFQLTDSSADGFAPLGSAQQQHHLGLLHHHQNQNRNQSQSQLMGDDLGGESFLSSSQHSSSSLSPPPLIINEELEPLASTPISHQPKTTSHQANSGHQTTSGRKQSRNNAANNYQTTTTTTTTLAPNSSGELQFKCQICHNDFQTICSFEYHMQRAHNVTSFGCEICHKPFASLRYVLTDHMRRCHGWRPTASSASPSSGARSSPAASLAGAQSSKHQ